MEKLSKFDIVCAALFGIGGSVVIMVGVICDEPLYSIAGVLWFILAKLYIGVPVFQIKIKQ